MVLHTNDCIPPGLFGHSLQALKSNYTPEVASTPRYGPQLQHGPYFILGSDRGT
ncbi:unnamed protein product [Penicillium camemberti]|uniref:Str. FM013 n=1 Tax=Penicillium camemberti (strain FM 013) TaxID=1429867 RepID=A0A0G4PPF2_PENC3|nr:unnamed protein product [Penicillium camemberti]